MRTVVTGGAGFIGSNLVDRLIEDGHEVVVVDDLSTGRRENVHPDAELREQDVRDFAGEADVIFHLAAQIDVRHSVADPAHDLEVNAGGTIAVLEAARASGAQVVLASTGGAIYGDTAIVPTPEDAPERPLAPYGFSKLTAEGYCRLFADLHGVRSTALRFANVYGPRQDPLGEGGVVAIFCGRVLDGEPAVIYGDGGQTRDFVYAGDVVDAFLAAVGYDGLGPYNVGTGRETTVTELAERVAAVAGRQFTPRHEPDRPGEVRRSCLDPARAERELGWTARTPLDEGLRLTLDWAAAQPES
jgi:UDP-glucose 4-epimerase